MKKTNLILSLILFPITGLFAQKKESNFELYILIGQSNMAGRGPITEEFKNEGDPRVLMFDKNNEWVLARNPVHFDKPKAAGVGPGLAFGIEMARESPRVRIGLIPYAVGGTSIEKWTPGAFDQATQTHPYDDALMRIRAALKYGEIKGVIWHQGEANSSEKKAPLYLVQLQQLIDRIRKEAGNPNLPFIVGELGRYREKYDLINAQLSKVPFTAVATSEGLVHKGDTTHFDGASANLLGKRFAEKMIEVQHQKK
jgi:hypothetical protein